MIALKHKIINVDFSYFEYCVYHFYSSNYTYTNYSEYNDSQCASNNNSNNNNKQRNRKKNSKKNKMNIQTDTSSNDSIINKNFRIDDCSFDRCIGTSKSKGAICINCHRFYHFSCLGMTTVVKNELFCCNSDSCIGDTTTIIS